MLKYRIQKRKYSSNIIEASDDGKNWYPYLIPAIKKFKGDMLCKRLINLLNTNQLADKLEIALYGPTKSHQDWANRFNIRGQIKDQLNG